MMRFRILWLSVLLLGVAPAAPAATLRVPSEYATINAALEECAFGDTVLVAPGTYTDWELRSSPGSVESSAAFLVDGVVLRSEGGSSVTFIDMQGEGVGSANTISVRLLPSEETVIEGFTIQGVPYPGSAILVFACGKVTVRDCRIFDVGAQVPGTGASALRCRYSDLEVTDCWFENCSASGGGAIGQLGGSTLISNCDFRSCSFNAVLLNGDGGISPTAGVRDCRFVNNLSDSGAAALAIERCSGGVLVVTCRFEDNLSNGSSGGGGAVAIVNNSRPATVNGCTFARNRLAGNNGGGSIVVGMISGVIDLSGNTFYGSEIENLYNGAAIFLSGGIQVTLSRNIIASSSPGPAVGTFGGAQVASSCNVFWENPGGNVQGFSLSPTDRVVDPAFCDPDSGDLTLSPLSPCLPANSLGCGLIGALDEGCGIVSIETESWSRIKAKYR
jgi:hypothetical protein